MSAQQQYIAFYTIFRKETVRIIRIWPQTLLPPIITQALYFLIFGKFIGSQISDINGISYMAFIVPGLVMMSVINNSFTNVVGSFFSAKFQRSIEEILVAPVSEYALIAGYVAGGVFRGLMCGILVFIVSIFFTHPVIHHLGLIILFIALTAVVFSLGGLMNAIFAKKFDDVSIFPTFVLTPLIYLGGVFYSIGSLPEHWQFISRLNPILYMVNGFRFGFHGISDVHIGVSLAILISFAAVLLVINLVLLRKGVGLKV